MSEVRHINSSDIKQIREDIRALLRSADPPDEIIAEIPCGVYRPEDFSFTEEDCSPKTKVAYRADKGAVIHGGVTIPSAQWLEPDAEMCERFAEEARPHIKMLCLADYGLTRDDWGEEIAIGSSNSSGCYDDAPTGCGCEFFTGDRRMIKARYPNAGKYAELDAIADVGDVHEFPPQNYYEDWNTRRNHRGGIYIIDKSTNERVKHWKDPSTAWMFGYFFWDWADSSTPVSIRTENRAVYPKFVSSYGARAGARYYLYNIPEELDSEGEWYLNRENGRLYFYPYAGAETADFSFGNAPLISCKNTTNMTFSGFTLMCTMNNALVSQGTDMTFENLLIKNVAQNGMVISGERNLVRGCEITRTGKGGIFLTGGESRTLTHGDNRAANNYIHDFSEISLTYNPGISLNGVGNIADHNEIANTPHVAISYGGNEHLIEYNDIHDATLQSNDAGAIYCGRDMTAYGNVIRYNRLKNIGGSEFHPQGIYWDDVQSGQTAYGNILINVGNFAFQVGGGRENVVENNLIVGTGGPAIEYDSRLNDGYRHGGWYAHYKEHWVQVESVPRDQEPWLSRYPRLAKIKLDETGDKDDIDFITNSSYGSVKNNIAIEAKGGLYAVAENVWKYSEVKNNYLYDSKEAAAWDETKGNLSSDSPVYKEHPDFIPIPVEDIGRKPTAK